MGFQQSKLAAMGLERQAANSALVSEDEAQKASAAAAEAKKSMNVAVSDGLKVVKPLTIGQQQEDEEAEPLHTLEKQRKSNNNCKNSGVGLQRDPGNLDPRSQAANPLEALDACVV